MCRNAQKQPFKYICKYFNIEKNEKNLEYFEELLNNFSAVEDGKEYLMKKKEMDICVVSAITQQKKNLICY